MREVGKNIFKYVILVLFFMAATFGYLRCNSEGGGEVEINLTVTGKFRPPMIDSGGGGEVIEATEEARFAVTDEPTTCAFICTFSIEEDEGKSITIDPEQASFVHSALCSNGYPLMDNEEIVFFDGKISAKRGPITVKAVCCDPEAMAISGVTGCYEGRGVESTDNGTITIGLLLEMVTILGEGTLEGFQSLLCSEEAEETFVTLLFYTSCGALENPEDDILCGNLENFLILVKSAFQCPGCGNGIVEPALGEECDPGIDPTNPNISCDEGYECKSCKCEEIISQGCEIEECTIGGDECPDGTFCDKVAGCCVCAGGVRCVDDNDCRGESICQPLGGEYREHKCCTAESPVCEQPCDGDEDCGLSEICNLDIFCCEPTGACQVCRGDEDCNLGEVCNTDTGCCE